MPRSPLRQSFSSFVTSRPAMGALAYLSIAMALVLAAAGDIRSGNAGFWIGLPLVLLSAWIVFLAIGKGQRGQSSFAHLPRNSDDPADAQQSSSGLTIAENLFDLTSEGVIFTDQYGKIVRVNPAFCRITGYSEAESVGRTPRMLKSGLQGADFYRALWNTVREAGQWSGEIWNRRKNGEAYPEYLTIRRVEVSDSGEHGYVGIFSDISKNKAAEETIRNLTYFDPVTRLPNANLLDDRLRRSLDRGERKSLCTVLVMVGLDRFKAVNESFGHDVGDQLLQSVAQRLAAAARLEDTVARLRGDIFCFIIADLLQPSEADIVVSRLLDSFNDPFSLAGHELFVTVSLGIAVSPNDGMTPGDLLQNAETAMNRGKDLTSNSYQYYAPEMNAHAVERLHLETDLRKAIARDELLLHYQPKIDALTGALTGAEALIRWRHAEMGLIPPSRFIPLAEETGLIAPIGAWVVRAVCQQIRDWSDAGLPIVPIAVNLSAHQFRQSNLVETIAGALEISGVNPNMIELELTESSIMDNPDDAVRTLDELHRLGSTIAIDDFGTGYSSLSYLTRFPLDKLKIDRSFVKNLGEHKADTNIVSAIIAMAHSLDLKVVAEGVETEMQFQHLRNNGCNEIQGYFFSPPVPAESFAELLRAAPFVERVKANADETALVSSS